MKPSAQIKEWMTSEELATWVREARNKETYQKRLAIWLTHLGGFSALQIAEMIQVSKQAVWLWVGQYKRGGQDQLERKGRGGRRWFYLSWAEEETFLRSLETQGLGGEFITARQIRDQLQKAVGKEITLAYVYKLLHRHGWRKIGPQTQQGKANRKARKEIKKTSH